MSSVPRDVLSDVLQPLDRWTLDAVQISDRRFRRLTVERMSGVCLREVQFASFRAPDANFDGTWEIRISGRPELRGVPNAHPDYTAVFAAFITRLRSANVHELAFWAIRFTPALMALVLEAPIIANSLTLGSGSCADLTPAQLQELVLYFAPTSLNFAQCLLRSNQVSDNFLRVLSKNRVREIEFPGRPPEDGGFFGVTDDGLVDLCVHQGAPAREDGDAAPRRRLLVYFGTFTKDLFKRLVEANTASTHTHPLHMLVGLSRVEDEDLHDFVDHLSYRYRGSPNGQWRIYDFFGARRGALTAMDLQIVLLSNGLLKLTRARRPNISFEESDE